MKRKLWLGVAGLILALGLGLAAWGFYFEPSSLVVHRYPVEIDRWPPEQSGLVIALLSDLHVGSPYVGVAKLEEVVRRVNAARPDLVLLAGDYVIHGVFGGNFVPPEETAAVLAKLEAPLGVHAVLGNHEWWYDAARVRRAFIAEGIPVLENECRRLKGRGFDFWLVGLGDWWEARPGVEKVLDGVDDEAPVIVFTHNPDVFPEIPGRVALTLAGHTHGGQVRIPLLGAPVVPSRYGDRYAHGHVVENGRHLFVTSGLGTSIFPVRFGVPPEIALVVVHGGSAAVSLGSPGGR